MMTIKDREIVWADPFGLEAAKFDGAEITPIPGLEVTELRTTAPTTMRRWDQYFGPQNRAELAPDYMSPLAGLTDTDYSATLPNGMRVIGTQEQVDKMVAYYGKKAEPEADLSSIEVVNGGFDDAAELIHSHLMENGIREPRPVRVTLDDGTEAQFVAQLRGDGSLSWTPAEADPMAILAAEYANASMEKWWADKARAARATPADHSEPEPKRSPNAKPAISGLSIEAPLGNRYGGLGWCDE